MLEANPDGWWSSQYTVVRDGVATGALHFRALREAGLITVGDQRFEVRRERAGSGNWLLEGSGGVVVASAQKPSAWRSQIIVRASGQPIVVHLRRPSTWRRSFEVLQSDRRVGEIRRASIWRRRTEADLPDGLPEAVQVFCVWLVLLLFRREDSAAASGGGS